MCLCLKIINHENFCRELYNEINSLCGLCETLFALCGKKFTHHVIIQMPISCISPSAKFIYCNRQFKPVFNNKHLMDQSAKTRKFLIATHGALAAGFKSALDIIIGAMEHVFLIQAYVDENSSVETEITEILKQVTDDDELVVFTDILGGSITNQILQHAQQPNIHIISGVNLPLVIEVMLADTETPVDELISAAIENAKGQMVYVNKLLTAQNDETIND